MPLELIVHDYDQPDLTSRADLLHELFPERKVITTASRRVLLRHILARPTAGPGAARPVVLVDLQQNDEEESLARGIQLLETIARHPDLRSKVTTVAFTRYGHRSRDADLRRIGVGGRLSPAVLRDPERREAVRTGLMRLASGVGDYEVLAAGPSKQQTAVLEVIDDLLPGYLPSKDVRRWEEAKRLLFFAQLTADGHDRASALRQSHIDTDRARAAVRRSSKALSAGLIKTGNEVDFSALARRVRRAATSEASVGFSGGTDASDDAIKAVWWLTSDRDPLPAPNLLRWAREQLADLVPAATDTGRSPVDGLWIPPADLPVIRDYLDTYVERVRPGHMSLPARMEFARDVASVVAQSRSSSAEEVMTMVRHGVLCLDEHLREPH